MITNQQIRTEVAQDWAALRKLCAGSHRQYAVAGAGGAMFINETPPESFFNLPLLLAFGVLDQVLAELIDQGTFKCKGKRPLLGAKMAASKNHLLWQNYDLVERGKDARNDLAHEAKLLVKADCLVFIDAIEDELKAWHVL